MSTQIDSVGTFLGTVTESGVNTTKKGFPQWVFRVAATKKFIESKDDLAHFKIEEPAYVDWDFDEEATGFMCLFNDSGPLLNYEQVQLATGWDGLSFDTLGQPIVGKTIQFRMQAKSNYAKEDGTIVDNTGKLEIGWVDAADAPATRQLKTLDAGAIKDLSSKFLSGLKKAPPAKPVAATAAKAVVKPGKPGGTPATASAPSTPSPAPVTAPPAASAAESTSTPAAVIPPTATKTKAPPKKTPPPAVNQGVPGLPGETTQGEAWDYVNAIKGGNEDSVIQDAWIAACGEVGPNYKDDSEFTAKDWAKVRDIVIKDLDLTPQNKAA